MRVEDFRILFNLNVSTIFFFSSLSISSPSWNKHRLLLNKVEQPWQTEEMKKKKNIWWIPFMIRYDLFEENLWFEISNCKKKPIAKIRMKQQLFSVWDLRIWIGSERLPDSTISPIGLQSLSLALSVSVSVCRRRMKQININIIMQWNAFVMKLLVLIFYDKKKKFIAF